MTNQSEQTTEQDLQNAEPAVLQAECDPSLKRTFKEKLPQAGFSSMSDALKTLVRDFVAGRINYNSGILESQQKNEDSVREGANDRQGA